jgi:inosine-uridine nucleoside N-ribohydrolase
MVCLGPLTNLAVAVKMQPKLKIWIKEVYALGGNITGK